MQSCWRWIDYIIEQDTCSWLVLADIFWYLNSFFANWLILIIPNFQILIKKICLEFHNYSMYIHRWLSDRTYSQLIFLYDQLQSNFLFILPIVQLYFDLIIDTLIEIHSYSFSIILITLSLKFLLFRHNNIQIHNNIHNIFNIYNFVIFNILII